MIASPVPTRQERLAPSKGRLARAARPITVGILIAQGAALLLAASVWAHGGAEGGLSEENLIVLAMSMLVFPPLGILGVTWGIVSAKKRWEVRAVAVMVSLISLVMSSGIVPMFVCMRVGSILEPVMRVRAAQVAQRAKVKHEAEREAHYAALVRRFDLPRRVVGMQAGYLLLDDRSVVHLLGFHHFGSWSPSNVIGREVQIVLPDRELFLDGYAPGKMSGFEGPRPTDPSTGTPYGDVPAYVVLEGELLNKRFSQYPDLLERSFQKRGAVSR